MAALSIEEILEKSGIAEKSGPYSLYRQDTHGCPYLMQNDFSKAAADFLVSHYTSLNHHQSYWAEIPEAQQPVLMPPR
jgi:hypothetical protein